MRELVGRRLEVAVAVEHLALAIAHSSAHVLLVEGPAGIGKSSILGALRAELPGLGFRTVELSLSAAETPLSWAGLITLCRSLDGSAIEGLPTAQRAALARALGGEGPGDVEPMLVAAALARLVADQVAEGGPLLVLVDDVHWLDQASAAALAFTIRASAGLPVAIVVASRPERRPFEPDRLVPEAQFRRIELKGLSLIELQQVLADRFGVVHRRPDLVRLHEACGGNVLHAIEIGRMVSAGHSLDEALVPPTLQAAIDAELVNLPDDVIAVLEVAALLARPTTASVERAVPGSEAALAAAEEAGIIRESNDGIAFAHPLVRAGLLDRIGGVRRRRLERHLASVVDDVEERTALLAAATVEPDEAIAAALQEAGDAAFARGAPHVAAARYERALELTPDHEPARAQRLFSAAQAHSQSGDGEHARPHHEAALALGLPPALEAAAVKTLAAILLEVEGFDAATALLQRSAARLRATPSARLSVLVTLISVQLFADLGAALGTAEQAMAEASASADSRAIIEVEALTAAVRVLRGEPVDIHALQGRLQVVDDPGANRRAPVYLAQVLAWTGHSAAAIAAETDELHRAVAAGHLLAEANACQGLADVYRLSGQWDAAETAYYRWADLTSLMGTSPTTIGAYADLGWMHAARGRFDDAVEVATVSVENTKATPVWHLHALVRAGFVALVHGDLERAVDRLLAARDLACGIGFLDPGALGFHDDLVEALLASGRLADAAADTARLQEAARRAGRARGLALAARARALLAAATGDLPAASAAVADALEAIDEVADPFVRARVLLLGGTVSRRAGRRTEARDQLMEARSAFAGLRATPFVERADAELQRLGARTGRTDLLTPGERQVAELVCAGRSNAEVAAELFVTSRTVEAHLTRAYRKLGVRSRAELIARRSLLDQA